MKVWIVFHKMGSAWSFHPKAYVKWTDAKKVYEEIEEHRLKPLLALGRPLTLQEIAPIANLMELEVVD